MKRIIGLAVVVALALGMMAVPASAGNVLGALQGTAIVGKVPGTCTKALKTNPSGHGIGLPIGTTKTENHAYYRITAPVVGMDSNNPGLLLGSIDACGELMDVADIGPACGMSKGYNGLATIFDAAGVPVYQAYDLVWKASIGGTLILTGKYDRYSPKSTKVGNLYAVFQAQGLSGCIAPQKAQSFNVGGVFAGVQGNGPKWNDVTNPIDDKGPNGPGIWEEKK